jgi:hypothetical protein
MATRRRAVAAAWGGRWPPALPPGPAPHRRGGGVRADCAPRWSRVTQPARRSACGRSRASSATISGGYERAGTVGPPVTAVVGWRAINVRTSCAAAGGVAQSGCASRAVVVITARRAAGTRLRSCYTRGGNGGATFTSGACSSSTMLPGPPAAHAATDRSPGSPAVVAPVSSVAHAVPRGYGSKLRASASRGCTPVHGGPPTTVAARAKGQGGAAAGVSPPAPRSRADPQVCTTRSLA